MKFSDITKSLEDAQGVEHDNRERLREVENFLHKKDGQWESEVITQLSGRPRYTFDRCGIVVDDIMGQIEQARFAVTVTPSGENASKETANIRNGIIRKSERLSGARYIYNEAARTMVEGGLAGWRVIQTWADSKSFYQDLLIKRVNNFIDRVWYDTGAEEPDMSDADFCFVLSSLTMADYEEKFPKGSKLSVGDDATQQIYTHKKEEVIIGEYLYKKYKTTELVMLSNNKVYEVNEDYEKVKDELKESGVEEVRRRKTKVPVVHQRFFDGSDFLSESKSTVFQYLPVIPVFGNFKVSERKVIYKGAVEPLMDPQRVLNYAESRKIEEGALAPRRKIIMTKQQALGHTNQLNELNVSADPALFYNHVEGQTPPFTLGGAEVNPSLTESTQSMGQHINLTAGTFQANRDKAIGAQSGRAIEKLENKENSTNYKYFQAMEIAIQHTGRVINDAIPVVYDTSRQLSILNADETEETVTINDRILDRQTNQVVELNNLSQGVYGVTCSVGAAFQNQQAEAINTLLATAQIDPSILQLGGDILLNNMNAPGIDKIAERKRMQMLIAGVIPDTQMTEEELVMVENLRKAQQEKGDPMELVAQAEAEKAQANTQETLSKIQDRMQKNELESKKLMLKQQELVIAAEKSQHDRMVDQSEQFISAMQAQSTQIKTQAETLKLIREAMGIDTAVGKGVAKAYVQQSKLLQESQETMQ